MNSKRPDGFRVWVQVSKKALTYNYQTLRKLLRSETRLMAVVKSNAYGHDFRQYAQLMQELGADWLGADSITEAIPLREMGIKLPILVLGYTLPENIPLALKNDISITVSNIEHLKALRSRGALGDKLKVHLKFDTGMCRQGFLPDEALKVFTYIQKHLPQIVIEGVYTHFAEAKNPGLLVKTKAQWAEFQKVLNVLEGLRLPYKIMRHAAATGATLTFPESHLDMVRLGIGLMGYWPEAATRARFEKEVQLQPALTWKTVVSEVKVLRRGGSVGYDGTERVAPATRLAILPVGYWHGYVRALSGVGNVLIHGTRAKVIGRVSMDMIAVDITHIPKVKIGDEAVLLGQSIAAEEIAALSGTSAYEVITRINPLTKRIYLP